jgi:hypothetical protein
MKSQSTVNNAFTRDFKAVIFARWGTANMARKKERESEQKKN